MLLMTKTTTIFLWVSLDRQTETQKLFLRHKNLKPQLKQLSRSSQLQSAISNTISLAGISATLSLTSPAIHQIPDYNADISGLCQLGNLQKAMDLVCKSEETILDLQTYCEILQLCADKMALNHGKRIHNLICSRGIEIDSVLGSKLVFMYVSCGDVREGRLIFDSIVKENVFLWNFMMNAYAKMGDYETSVCLFREMQEVGVEPDSYTLSCITKCFAAIGNANSAKTIHGYVLKLGFGFDNTVVNSMIALYFKSGSINNARKVFVKMSDRDVITWNTMISGYVTNGLAEKGFEVFEQMTASNQSVDLTTMVNVVVACANMGALTLGRSVHAYALKHKFIKKAKFCNTLLDMYSKCGDTDAALRVFKSMNERSVVSWTSMIAGFTREGKFIEAIKFFLEMRKEDVKPDTFTITSILHACASNGSLEKGKEVHNYIKDNNKMQSLPVSNALMNMYAKCGSMDDSYSVFLETPFKDIVSWNTIIGGYSKNRLPIEALDIFIKMQREMEPDNVTITCILPVCASLGALNKGREIHGYIMRKGLTFDQYVVNALIDMYVKCGVLVLARSLFNTTITKDLVTWTVMISGYLMHGSGHEAESMFRSMIENCINPSEASFTAILYACSHSGLLQEGWKFYNMMVKEYKIEPKLEHYSCMVDLLSRTGKLSKAYKFIKSMPVKPDATIWGALLCGCRFHHDVKLAEIVAERIFELEPENTSYYVLLANIYSEAEKWEEVKTLRDRIRKNNTECSWIEIKGKVNIFVTGDKDNPEGEKVEALLKKLKKETKNNGFSVNLKHELVSKDEMEKEGVVCGHSEKLAMGYGILKLPPGKTIRVTKNLRTCGECHEMAKFISKNVGRQIVLRDSNRFHHFKDGSCSCRGSW